MKGDRENGFTRLNNKPHKQATLTPQPPTNSTATSSRTIHTKKKTRNNQRHHHHHLPGAAVAVAAKAAGATAAFLWPPIPQNYQIKPQRLACLRNVGAVPDGIPPPTQMPYVFNLHGSQGNTVYTHHLFLLGIMAVFEQNTSAEEGEFILQGGMHV